MHAQIVIVDDNLLNLTLLASLAQSVTGLAPQTYTDPLEAMDACERSCPDLILVDYMMPLLSGIDFIEQVRRLPDRLDVPIVMVTTSTEKQVRSKALERGATEFLTKPIDPAECRSRMRNLLQLRHSQNLLRDREKCLQRDVAAATAAIHGRERELILRLSKAAEFRDPETGAHVNRMAHYSRLIAERLGLPAEFQQLILDAAPMHDVGKLGIPDCILLKPGKLTPEEFEVMKAHPMIGSKILSGSEAPLIRLGEEIARTHHEKYDGSGYPARLAGSAIPLSGRIVAVADVFDALTSERPYKKAWPVQQALDFLAAGAGGHFCQDCIHAFLGATEEAMRIRAHFIDEPSVSPPEATSLCGPGPSFVGAFASAPATHRQFAANALS